MLYYRTVVKWFSQKMVGPFFISSFDSSTAEQAEQRKNQRSDPKPTMAPYCTHNHDDNDAFHPSRSDSGTKHHKAVTTCQESARPAANSKKTKPHSSTNAKHGMRSAGSAECPSTTRRRRTPLMIHSISITSIPSRSTPSCSSTRQASNQATPAATDSEATKTHQHQSAH